MTRSARAARRLGVCVVAVLLTVACSSDDPDTAAPEAADTGDTGPVDERQPELPGAPDEVVEHLDDWPLPNRDYDGTRAVLDGPIDSSTVDRLDVAWRYELPGAAAFGNAATNPLVIGDTVYVGDLQSVVHAVDRESGDERWTASGAEGSMFGPSGVAVGWGKVFATQIGESGRGALIAAYDAATGEELWATDITGNGGEVNIQPSVYGGLVLAATSGFGQGVRGTIWALDQETGEEAWTFDVVESEDLWGNPDLNSGGGSWYPPAIDTEEGVALFGTTNPWPMPGAPGYPAGASRPGDNRWTNSTVALDVETGELRWGFQAFPHDIFDRDHVLASIARDGSERVVISTGKGGVVFGLDAVSGEELWSVPVGEHENAELTEWDDPIEVLPGAQGGVLTPTAVADGVVYVAAVNAPTTYASPEESSYGFTTALGSRPGTLAAISVTDGEILWETEVDGDPLGAMTVVNDLVFTSTLSGRIVALDRSSGEEAWSMQAEGGINGWPAVAGDLMVWPVGMGQPAHLLALRLS